MTTFETNMTAAGFRSRFQDFRARRAARRMERSTRVSLSRLSDDTLKDIGLHRGEIGRVARETSTYPQF